MTPFAKQREKKPEVRQFQAEDGSNFLVNLREYYKIELNPAIILLLTATQMSQAYV